MTLYNTCIKFNCYDCKLWGECRPHLILKTDRDTLIKNDKWAKVKLPKLEGGEE